MGSAAGRASLVSEDDPVNCPSVSADPVNCPSCGFANATPARFCGGCGKLLSTIASAVSEAERRRICVLFCDLVGSTLLSQRLDAEDLRDVMGAYQRTCEAVVLQHDGFVAQYRGDGIDVYFGYPHAHEDDASRAVRCAIGMVEAVRQLANAIKCDLQVRIGIHSGRVVVGTLGSSGRSERLAIGETPNIAARVQAEASPGEVVVSESLWRLLTGTFAAEPMGARKLKGVEQPVRLFKIVASGGQAAGLKTPRTPFIGRARQRARALQLWMRARSGVPQFVLLRGEPGIGKSRLIDVIRGDVGDDTDVLAARCTPFTTDTAFHPIVELIGARLRLKDAPAEERVVLLAKRMTELGLPPGDAVPLLSSILSVPVDPAIWPAPDLSPVRARQRTMEILIEGLHALSRRGPVLFTVEDLHWADASSIELLRQLIVSPRGANLLAIFTARPEFMPTWAAATNVTQVELEALDPTEAETFIRKVANDKPLPPEVVWEIRERAAGNPLFLEEITRSVMESDALVEREYSWELIGTLSSGVVPSSMEASLMARIDRLGEARSLLQLGATLGREFSHELLVATAESSEGDIRRQLTKVLESGLLFRRGGKSPIYTFKHALVHDAAYDSLLRTTRRSYHARIAEVLAARFPEVAQNRPELLAYHLSGAGSHAEAAVYWQAAGENAAKRSAVIEAVAHLRRALADLEQLPEGATRMDRKLSILTALGPVLMAVYGWAAPEVGETCRRAIELARRLGTNDRMYAPLWGLWSNQFVGGRLHEAMQTVAQVLQMASASGDPVLEMNARHAASYTHFYRGEFDASIAQAQAALHHYTPERERRIVEIFQLSSYVCCICTKASSLWMQGLQREGITLIEEMVAFARALRHPPSIAAALAFAMQFTFYDRDWKRLFALADETFCLSQAEGFAMWAAAAGMHRGKARIGLGDVEAGVAEVLEWGSLFSQTGSGVWESSFTSMISEALHRAGRSEEALIASGEGERRAKSGLVKMGMPEIYRKRGDILRDLDRLNRAEGAYCQAVACAREQGALALELRALNSLLHLRLLRGQPGDLPAKVRTAMAAMACPSDRPDLITARDLLVRSCV